MPVDIEATRITTTVQGLSEDVLKGNRRSRAGSQVRGAYCRRHCSFSRPGMKTASSPVETYEARGRKEVEVLRTYPSKRKATASRPFIVVVA